MDIKSIVSKNNPLIKEVAKLSDKKHRVEKNMFAFEGRKLLQEAIIVATLTNPHLHMQKFLPSKKLVKS